MASREISSSVDANITDDQEHESEGEQRIQDLQDHDSIAQDRLTIEHVEVSNVRFIYCSNNCKMVISYTWGQATAKPKWLKEPSFIPHQSQIEKLIPKKVISETTE